MKQYLVLILLFVNLSFILADNRHIDYHQNIHLIPKIGECGIEYDDHQRRIFGGSETGLNEFPWMALISYAKGSTNTGFKCTGVLINKRYVLTAAHCIIGIVSQTYGSPSFVRLGEHDLKSKNDCNAFICNGKPLDIFIEKLIPHYLFIGDNNNKHNDIGLCRLAKSVDYRANIQPICLPINTRKLKPNDYLFISGWGLTEKSKSSDTKLKAFVPAIATSVCTSLLQNKLNISDLQICAGGELLTDTCNGDSGGPLVSIHDDTDEIYFVVEGVVSFGSKNCGTYNIPGIYTNVSKYLHWILINIKP